MWCVWGGAACCCWFGIVVVFVLHIHFMGQAEKVKHSFLCLAPACARRLLLLSCVWRVCETKVFLVVQHSGVSLILCWCHSRLSARVWVAWVVVRLLSGCLFLSFQISPFSCLYLFLFLLSPYSFISILSSFLSSSLLPSLPSLPVYLFFPSFQICSFSFIFLFHNCPSRRQTHKQIGGGWWGRAVLRQAQWWTRRLGMRGEVVGRLGVGLSVFTLVCVDVAWLGLV